MGYRVNDRICTYCGQAGHRAHACPRRPVEPDRGANWPFPRQLLTYPVAAPLVPDRTVRAADLERLPDAPF